MVFPPQMSLTAQGTSQRFIIISQGSNRYSSPILFVGKDATIKRNQTCKIRNDNKTKRAITVFGAGNQKDCRAGHSQSTLQPLLLLLSTARAHQGCPWGQSTSGIRSRTWKTCSQWHQCWFTKLCLKNVENTLARKANQNQSGILFGSHWSDVIKKEGKTGQK